MFQLFVLRSRQPNDVDQMLLFRDGAWFLLKEEKNVSPPQTPVRLVLRIDDSHIALFFHNREVEVIPSDDHARAILAHFGEKV